LRVAAKRERHKISPMLRLLGLLFAVLALAAQLGVAATLPAALPYSAKMNAICHADDNTDAPLPDRQQRPECAICPFCLTLVSQASMLVGGIIPEPPQAGPVAPTVVLPPATAPPEHTISVPPPRGPPLLA
jgi:hypothetical protein